eukprot:TRINITY_DN62155_c0_g1_i2.p1 TRINITY_DN62155_c0_g1~~TRINITY_DN62155_c0_g1_i2.p1  ORF type:complete len:167 (+),score=48.41 TRINITY_DN62155_c0_g1_i2:85-585(+)
MCIRDRDEDAMKEFYKHQSDNDKDKEKKKNEKKKEREAAFIKELEAKRQEVIKAAMDVLSNLKKELEPNDFGQIKALEKKEKREIADEERKIRRRQRRLAAGWTMEMVKAEEDKLILEALSLIHISEPTRLLSISYAVFCLKKKTKNKLQYVLIRIACLKQIYLVV